MFGKAVEQMSEQRSKLLGFLLGDRIEISDDLFV
jgi:hypothetical protein